MAPRRRAPPPAGDGGGDGVTRRLACGSCAMAVVAAGARVGVAWVDAARGELRVGEFEDGGEDVGGGGLAERPQPRGGDSGGDEAGNARDATAPFAGGRWRCVALAKAEARPSLIFASTKASDALLEALEAPLDAGIGDPAAYAAPTSVIADAQETHGRAAQRTMAPPHADSSAAATLVGGSSADGRVSNGALPAADSLDRNASGLDGVYAASTNSDVPVQLLPSAYFAYEDAMRVLECLHVDVDDPCAASATNYGDGHGPHGSDEGRARDGGSAGPGQSRLHRHAQHQQHQQHRQQQHSYNASLPGGHQRQTHQRQRVRALLDTSQQAQVRAAGALLLALERSPDSPVRRVVFSQRRVPSSRASGDTSERMCVRRVREVSFRGLMYVDVSALSALQVFTDDRHPSDMGVGKALKEGFSLFSLLDRCVTRAGRATLRRWLLLPLADAGAIRARQEAVQHLRDCAQLHEELAVALRPLQDVPKLLARMAAHGAATSEHDWTTLGRAMRGMAAVHAAFCAAVEGQTEHPLARSAAREINVRALQDLADVAFRVIDVDIGGAQGEARASGKGTASKAPPTICRGVCEELGAFFH